MWVPEPRCVLSRGSLENVNARAHGVNPWLVLVLVCLAQFMVILDATIVNVALPSIQADLGLSESGLQWIVNAYALLFGGFLLLGGRAGDLIGRKRVFLAGLVLFTTASFVCGLATGETMLIVSRGIQGLGAALVSPAALSIVTTTFREGSERTKALGVWAAIAVGGSAVGLVLGGFLVETFSWPWIFFVNIPVGIATFVFALRFVPGVEGRACAQELRPRRGDDGHRGPDRPRLRDRALGRAGLGLGRGARLPRSRRGAAGRLRPDRAALRGAARAPLDLRRQDRARRERRDVRRRGGLFAMFFFNTLYLQRVLGFSPLEAGFAFVPFTLGVIASAGFSQKLVPALGARDVPLIGLGLAFVGLLTFLRLTPDSSYLTGLLPGILLTSLGMGLVFVPITLIATSGIPADDAGLASGLFNTSQQIGGAVGLALLSTFATNKTSDALASYGRAPTKAEQSQALVDGFHVAWLGSALLLGLAAVLLFVLLRRRDVVAVAEGQIAPVAA